MGQFVAYIAALAVGVMRVVVQDRGLVAARDRDGGESRAFPAEEG